MKRFRVFVAAVLLAAAGYYAWQHWPVHIELELGGPTAGWPAYGGDDGGSRYAALTQIDKNNVRYLKPAWEYHTGDVSDGEGDIPSTTAFEATPILADGRLYFPTPFNRVIALDPETGKELWKFDPKTDLKGHYANQLISRGVTYWETGDAALPSPKRIFTATNDGRLFALDATTGEPCTAFAKDGMFDLNEGVGEQRYVGEYQVTSPPVIAGDTVVVGSAVVDNQRVDIPSGVVRAFDARTGALRWSWDLAPPPDKRTAELAVSDAGYALGTPNVWAPMSVDAERDLVFMPTGNPSPDYYGGLRHGLDYYGSCVVAVRASSGDVVWRYQTVHNDLWDFDVPCQPTLTEIQKDGETVPVVIQATKMGFIFVLHRETGEPVFPVEERAVPQSPVPGEKSAPTQPFPVLPPPLVPTDLKSDEAWGLLGFDQKGCAEQLQGLHFEGMYTPPQVIQPTLMFPGNAGGTNWGGVAVDPFRQKLVVNAMNLAWVVSLIPADEFDAVKAANPHVEISRQEGTPYGMRREVFLSKLGLPCNPPPWGVLTTIDLTTGEIDWQIPFGTVRDIAPVPLPINYGVPNLGGPLITESGLVFIGAALDDYLRAYDLDTGEELWKGRLPAGGQATPMTYRLREDSRQYVVLAAGGHGKGGSTLGDSVIAYALP
ncbi:MAG: PQQ-binding-like beta-propeller repeat protein [Candidatus Hydrogenedens sp.]|nr:PQQ-binding-like beta-propeller repeat protein [Candidatus Hydrogenedens sp.]